MGRFLPPDHSKGDESTVGGYMAVHARPAAFEGPDGTSYSVDVGTDQTGDRAHPWGGYLLFVRWTAGDPSPAGHLETGFLAYGDSEDEVIASVGAMPLEMAKTKLDELVSEQSSPGRPWWEAMQDENGGASA